MGWFDEQIKQRKLNDDAVFSESFIRIADAVTGGRLSAAWNDKRAITKDAIDEIFRFYHIKSREIPDSISDINEQLEYLMRPYGIMRRTVKLEEGWYRDAIGAMIGVRKSDGRIVAFIPSKYTGYTYYDIEAQKRIRITKKNQDQFETDAIAFYKPFPLKELHIPDLLRYMAETLSITDLVMMAMSGLSVALIGMLIPKLNYILFSNVIESGSVQLLLAITAFMVCVSMSSMLLSCVKQMITLGINTKMSIAVQSATMMRIISLPSKFFKDYSSGELSVRAQQVNALCTMLVNSILSVGLTSVFSLVYISQIFVYAPALVVPALMIIAVTVLFSVVTALIQMRISRKQMELAGKENGMCYSMISGIQKIKLSGSEKRAFARWGNLYAKEIRYIYDPPTILKLNSVITLAITLSGTLIMYYTAIRSGVSVADYYAFNTAYAMVSGAFLSLTGTALTTAKIKPILDMVAPIFKAVPEISEGKQMITKLGGEIEIDHLSFRYRENMPFILDDLSLKIRPGQYVAIVGSTGCGKSTLMRLLLGFETPQRGSVYYDGIDIGSIDLKSLRRNIGVVMQDGKLFQGDIYSNITISAPWLSVSEAWDAAELAGIADDIRRMPMGMHTLISEGSGGISGGQRQRLLIARAVAPNPKILMFDEATSALDNVTQKKVSESLDGLHCTRIIIAHRLSTIKHCDRIIVMDKGKIIEDGSYDELISKNGFFADLVERQRIE